LTLHEIHRYKEDKRAAQDTAEELVALFQGQGKEKEAEEWRQRGKSVKEGEPLNRVVVRVGERILELHGKWERGEGRGERERGEGEGRGERGERRGEGRGEREGERGKGQRGGEGRGTRCPVSRERGEGRGERKREGKRRGKRERENVRLERKGEGKERKYFLLIYSKKI
jgi:hypothetical protein